MTHRESWGIEATMSRRTSYAFIPENMVHMQQAGLLIT